MSFWANLFGGAARAKPEDVPKVRSIVDKIAAQGGRRTGPGWSRSSGAYKSVDELAQSEGQIKLDKLLTSDDLNLARDVGFDDDLLRLAVHAFSFHSINHQVGQDTWRDDVSTTVGDQAVDKLCRIKGPISSYILHKVAAAQPVTVALSDCKGSYSYTFDFKARTDRARKELKRRGFEGRDPLGVDR